MFPRSIFWVNNQLLNFDLQFSQRSLAFFFPDVFSECDLILENMQPNYIDMIIVMHTSMLLIVAIEWSSPCTQWAAVMMNLDAISVPPHIKFLNFPFFIFLMKSCTIQGYWLAWCGECLGLVVAKDKDSEWDSHKGTLSGFGTKFPLLGAFSLLSPVFSESWHSVTSNSNSDLITLTIYPLCVI